MGKLIREKSIITANPGAGYMARKNEIDSAVAAVLDSGWYVLGNTVSSFEDAFALYIGANYGIGVASGTDALLLSLKACDIGPGDAVVTVSHTAVATVAAVVLSGAQPVLIDIDEATFTLDPTQLENTLHDRPELNIKAVIPSEGFPLNILKFLCRKLHCQTTKSLQPICDIKDYIINFNSLKYYLFPIV